MFNTINFFNLKNMKFFKPPLFKTKYLFLLAIFVTSCIGDNFKFDNVSTDSHIKPEYKVPVAYADLSLKDLMPDNDSLSQFIELNDEGYFDIYYQQQLFSLTAAGYVDVPDQLFEQALKLSDTELGQFNNFPLDFNIARTYDYPFSAPQGMHIDNITFNSGQMHILMSSQWDIDIDIVLKLPGFTKNNGADTLTLDFGNVHDQPADITVDLDGYTIDLTKQETVTNILQMDYDISLSQQAGNSSTADDQISVNVSITDIGFASAAGYFGTMSQTISQEIPIALANNLFSGQIEVENPQFNLFYQNSFGLPISAQFNTFYATGLDDQNTNINLPPELSPFNLSLPPTIGELTYDTVSINGQNSNLFDVILNFPRSLTLDGEVALNNGIDPNLYSSNFVPGDGLIDISVEFRLPLSARFSVLMQDTIPFDFASSIPAVDQIDQFNVNLGLDNGFPITLGIQVYFVDSVYNVLDSLFTEFPNNEDMQYIEGATGNTPVHNDLAISIDNQKTQKISSTKYMFFKALITSAGFDTPGQYIQIVDSYEVGFTLAFDVKLDINPSDFAGGTN